VTDDLDSAGKGLGRRIDPGGIAARLATPTIGAILVVVIIGALVGGVAALSIRRQDGVYQSSEPLLIDQAGALAVAPNGDIVAKLALLRVKYVSVMQSADVLGKAAATAGVDIGTVAGAVSASAPPQSLIIQINARTKDPAVAPRIASATADALRDYLTNEQAAVPAANRITLTPLRNASAAVKVEPTSTRSLSNGLTAGLLAAAIAYLVLASVPPFGRRRRVTDASTVPGPTSTP
jgi:capsular polysaccharide biosynthesis protein